MAHSIHIHRDADYKQACRWLNNAGGPMVLSNVTFVANLKSYPTRTTVNLSPTVVVTDAANGLFDVVFTAAQTTALLKDRYVWEVMATVGVYTLRIISGDLYVRDTGDQLDVQQLQTTVLDAIADDWVETFL